MTESVSPTRARIAALLVATLVVVACGGDDDSEGVGDDSPAEADDASESSDDASASADGGSDLDVDSEADDQAAEDASDDAEEHVLVIAQPSDIGAIDPVSVIDDVTHELVMNIYEGGVQLRPAETPIGEVAVSADPDPGLFESWTISDDGLTYTFKLREGVMFHNGTEMTAEDAAYSFNRALGTPAGGQWVMNNIVKTTSEMTVLGDYEFQLTADEPSAIAVEIMFADTLAILDKESVEPHATEADPWATEWLSENISPGTGPYVLRSRVPGEELVLEAFDDYWGGRPAYDRIIWKIVPSAAERLTLLKAGSVDIAMGLTPQQVADVQADDDLQVFDGPSFRQTAIGLHAGIEPLDDLTLRQAISFAVDYQDIIDNVYLGGASRSYGPLPAGSALALGPDEIGYTYDPERAAALVGESSYDGETLTISYNNAVTAHQDIAVRVQAQLTDLGLNVELEPLNNTVFDERLNGKDLQIWIRDVLSWVVDPNFVMGLFYECDQFFNWTAYCDESVDAALDAGWVTTDPDERFEVFAEAQRTVVDGAPWVWIAQANLQVAAANDVTGWVTPQNLIPIYRYLEPTS